MKIKRKTGVRGRPKIQSEAIRRTVGVRLNAAEWDAVQRKADALGIRPTTLLRVAALSRVIPKPVVPAINRQLYAELARLAGNINQLTRAAHEGRVSIAPAMLQSVGALVRQLRLELLGVPHDSQGD